MSVTGSVRVDLTDVPASQQRYLVGAIEAAPSRSRVVLVVGSGRAEFSTITLLQEHVGRLRFDVQGEPESVREWIAALRGDDLLGRCRVSIDVDPWGKDPDPDDTQPAGDQTNSDRGRWHGKSQAGDGAA